MDTIQKLLRADTEEEVLRIIDAHAEMRNPDNWYPIDNRDTNNNVISNQSSNGGKAATELITNMVDAILTKRCLEENIDPKSSAAPPTMYKAVDEFVRQLHGGKIFNADDAWLKDYSSENLIIGVTGSPKGEVRPCYTFCDNGEGQEPNEFRDTFLSLSAKNKSEIPFVQGKYNMGSSGVLIFCGKHWFKLIVSRRYDARTPWGWTLIRRKETTGMPYAEYFAPERNIEISNVDAIFPFFTRDNKQFDRFSLRTGTIIKLYEYYTGKGHSGFRVTREVFNENLVETILPFRIYDFRQTLSKERGGLRALGIDERPFNGLEFLLRRTHQESDDSLSHDAEDPIDIGTEQHPELGEIKVTAIPLGAEAAKTGWFKQSGARVFHHVNGQVQFKRARGFLTQCGLSTLKDRVVIFVDASKLKDAAHHDVWKGDRQTIKETPAGEQYEDVVKRIIKDSPELKELNHRVKKEMLNLASKDGARDMLKDLVKRDKNFSLLLDGTVPDGVAIGAGDPAEKEPRADLKHDPTHIKIKGKKIEISVPINRGRPIGCETNAQDDFFMRPDNRGSLLLSDDDAADKFSINHKLANGELAVFLRPNKSAVTVGDEFKFQIGMYSDSMPRPIFSDKTLAIKIAKKSTRKSRPGPRPEPKTPHAGFPPYKLLTKDGREVVGETTTSWADCAEFDCTEHDGGHVYDLGEGQKMYYINCDHASLTSYLKSLKVEERVAASKKYIISMRVMMLGLEHALSSVPEEASEHDDTFRKMAAKGAATVAMTVCDHLPKVFELDKDRESDE